MPRKKVSADAENDALNEEIGNLEDDEEITIQDTRKIRKSRTSRKEPAEVVEVEPDDDDDASEFSPPETSIAGLFYADNDQQFHTTIANIIIRRNPDSFGDKFLKPCESVLTLPPMRNVDIFHESSKLDTEEKVRNLYGGGHYFFQVQLNGQIGKSWKESLADSPEAIRAAEEKQAAQNQPKTEPLTRTTPETTTTLSPDEQLIKQLEMLKRMRELTDNGNSQELAALKEQIETMRADAQKQQIDSLRDEIKRMGETNHSGSDLSLLLKHSDAPNFDKLIDRVLPSNESGIVKDIVDGAKEILPYGEQIGTFFGGLFRGFTGTNAEAAKEPTEAEIMKALGGSAGQTEQTADAPKSNFKRRSKLKAVKPKENKTDV